MLIFPDDVTPRRASAPDDLPKMRAAPAWAALRVAEQIEELLAGGTPRGLHGRITIPASYTPGVTLLAKAGSDAAAFLAAGGAGNAPK